MRIPQVSGQRCPDAFSARHPYVPSFQLGSHLLLDLSMRVSNLILS